MYVYIYIHIYMYIYIYALVTVTILNVQHYFVALLNGLETSQKQQPRGKKQLPRWRVCSQKASGTQRGLHPHHGGWLTHIHTTTAQKCGHKTWRRPASELQKTCRRTTEDLHNTCRRHAEDMQKTCRRTTDEFGDHHITAMELHTDVDVCTGRVFESRWSSGWHHCPRKADMDSDP